ncbi:DUF998 domain-containing protein [Clostridium senegalense]
MKKIYPLLGVIASISYIIYVSVGGVLSDGEYSHLTNAISDLPYFIPQDSFIWLEKLTIIYRASLVFFSIIAFIDFKKYKPTICRIAFLLVLVNSLVGMMMTFFPMDVRDSQITFIGITYIVLTGFSLIFSTLPPLFIGIGVKNIVKFRHLTIYSMISSLIIFISGCISAVGAVNEYIYFGVFERITIGTYIIWILVVSMNILFSNIATANLEKYLKNKVECT